MRKQKKQSAKTENADRDFNQTKTAKLCVSVCKSTIIRPRHDYYENELKMRDRRGITNDMCETK